MSIDRRQTESGKPFPIRVSLGKRLVFITDGAVWIKNWIADAYPQAVAIPDFFHAKEYLCQFAKEYFKFDIERDEFIRQQSDLLLQSETLQVIEYLKTLYDINPIPSAKQVIDYTKPISAGWTINITKQ